ncbi:MAG: hypothetical protein HYU53_00705 [Acidobacteria bacterium]|nr:hypothetical protein [Acidobacteriota bacterium]
MPDADIQHDLKLLETELKKLEAEYNMFFAGRLPRPPWETRGRVESLIKRWDRAHIQTSMDRFRFNTLQTRFNTFADLWDRGLRAREEGRPGPFAVPKPPEPPKKPARPEAKVVHVASFTDPMREMDKLHALYDSLMDARRAGGEDIVPFHKFTALVKDQVKKIRESGNAEVAFRVAVKEGKVTFTARGMKGKR